MENSALLLIHRETSKLESSTSCKRMPTSICTTLRLNGVLSTKNTIRLNATTLITGKTSEGNPTFLSIRLMSFVKIGKLELSLANTRKVAFCKQLV